MFRYSQVLLFVVLGAANILGCGGDSPTEPEPLVIRAEGYVRLSSDGSPVAGVNLKLWYAGNRLAQVRTDDSGYYFVEAEFPYTCPSGPFAAGIYLVAYPPEGRCWEAECSLSCTNAVQSCDVQAREYTCR